jgi:hypothetical protein
VKRFPGGGMGEFKKQEVRKVKDRRTQQRRDVEGKHGVFDRLFKFLLASIIAFIGVWVYIFTK